MNKTSLFRIVLWKVSCGYFDLSELCCVTDNTDVSTELKCATKHWEREGTEGLIVTLVESRPPVTLCDVSLSLDLVVRIVILWKNYPISESSILLHQFTRRAIKWTVIIIVGYHPYKLHTKLFPIYISEG
jgi:hypothetical protein